MQSFGFDAAFAQGATLPEGAKSAGAIDWNTIILTLIGSGGVVSSLVMVLNSWVQRNPQTKLHLTLPECGELKIEGSLTPDSDLYQQALELMKLCLDQQTAVPILFKDDPALADLYQKMNERLNLNGIKEIYFMMGYDYEQFGGESLAKSGKIQLLLKQSQRQNRLSDLKQKCREVNNSVNW